MPVEILTFTGPLPVTKTVAPPANGPAVLTVAGSGWTQNQDSLIGIDVTFEGQGVGTSSVWSNGATTHRAFVPSTFEVQLDKPQPQPGTPASYSITLSAFDGTLTDENDNYSVVLWL